jgi:hypothetical protein
MTKRIVIAFALLIVCSPLLVAQQVTDAEAMALLLREPAKEAAMRVTGDAVELRVLPEDAPVAVTQIFAEEQLRRGRTVRSAGGEAPEHLTVEIWDMYSSTAPGENSTYFRSTHVTLGVLLTDDRDARISWSQEFVLSRTDTLTGTPSYEEKSWLEEETSWWDALVAPALVTVTAGVIVLLLFTVRGSS